MSIRFLSLLLALSLCSTASAADVPPEVEAALNFFSLHKTEASGKAAQLERARAKGLIAGDSWAPLLNPSPIDVSRYDLQLFLDFSREVVSGSVEIELTAVQPDLSTIELDAWSGLRVLGTTLLQDDAYPFDSPVDLDFSHENDMLTIELPRALMVNDDLRILVTYGGRAGHQGNGINWERMGSSAGLPISPSTMGSKAPLSISSSTGLVR